MDVAEAVKEERIFRLPCGMDGGSCIPAKVESAMTDELLLCSAVPSVTGIETHSQLFPIMPTFAP